MLFLIKTFFILKKTLVVQESNYYMDVHCIIKSDANKSYMQLIYGICIALIRWWVFYV